MVIACKGIDILKRVLCLLLCVVLLFCFFMVPRAGAVALEATTIAYGGLLVGTILVGAGVVFSSHGDMVKVGNAMYKTLVNGSSAIGKTISSISAWAVEHGTSLAKGALRVGKDMYQAIVDAFNASYSGGVYSITGQDFYVNSLSAVPAFADSFTALRAAGFTGALADGTKVDGRIIADHSSGNWMYRYEYYQNGQIAAQDFYGPYIDPRQFFFCFDVSNTDSAWLKLGRVDPDGTVVLNAASIDFWRDVPFSVSAVGGVSIPSSDLKYPSDDYLVRMPDIPSVDTGTGDVTYPDSIAYTKDAVAVPYPVDTEGVKVPDIPFDKPVDKSTGKTLDGTDTGTDTDNPSKPGEGTDTDNPNWPDTGSLSLPKLIASKFPFCIPFDVARLVGLLEAEPKAPVFRIPVVYANIVNEEIVIDFDKFADVLQIIRWGEIMLFVAGLVVITRNYIKW